MKSYLKRLFSSLRRLGKRFNKAVKYRLHVVCCKTQNLYSVLCNLVEDMAPCRGDEA